MRHMSKGRRLAFAGITSAAVLTLPAVGVAGPASAASATEAKKAPAGVHYHPQLTVTPSKNLRDGRITVRGTGYDTTVANPFGTGNAGTYVEIGWITSAGWKPSRGFPEDTRSNADAIWTHSDPTPGDPKQAQLRADGSVNVLCLFSAATDNLARTINCVPTFYDSAPRMAPEMADGAAGQMRIGPRSTPPRRAGPALGSRVRR